MVFAALTPPPKVAKAANTPPAAPTFEEPLPPPPPDPVVSPSPVAPVAAPVVSPPPVATGGSFEVNQRVLFRGQGGTVRYIGETNIGVGEPCR